MQDNFGADVTLTASGGGKFEITVDGHLAYSKKAVGRFPTDEELDALAVLTNP